MKRQTKACPEGIQVQGKRPEFTRHAREQIAARVVQLSHLIDALESPDRVEWSMNDRGRWSKVVWKYVGQGSRVRVVIDDGMGPRQYGVLSVNYRGGALDNGK